MVKKFLIASCIALFLLLSSVIPVYAIGDPSSILIPSIRVFQNLWETGDQLYIIEHKVMYDPDPEEDPEDTFVVGIWEGSTLKCSKPLEYYDHNFSTIYLNSSQALEWEGDYSAKVVGNPVYFPELTEGVNKRTVALSETYWISGTQEESRAALGLWCIGLAEDLEVSWGIDLLTSTGKLNTVGAAKFREAIPGLDGVCPEIFQVHTTYPEVPEKEHTKIYEIELQSRMGERLQTALNNLGTFLHIPGVLVGGIGLSILYFILAGRIFTATGSVPIAVVVSLPFLFAGNLIGVLPLSITFIAGLLVLVMFGLTFIIGRLG